ncbi:hypothetical protein LCGC14_2728830 [marine sediment metagenome]|uniref:Uncharacterized protein n=1 Tax=marine sediment metagenome TaxID=412755 RepID=A0A0F9BH09_9ZZZZ
MIKIILRHAHDTEINGMVIGIENNATSLVLPMVCGCKLIFKSAGYTEKDFDGFDMEVYKQTDFVFKQYRY